jgi:PAS domain-containing protein
MGITHSVEGVPGSSIAGDRLWLVVDSAPALIHTSLPDGYLDFFNQSWLNYLGVSLEDVTGWKWTAVIHPEDVVAIVENRSHEKIGYRWAQDVRRESVLSG